MLESDTRSVWKVLPPLCRSHFGGGGGETANESTSVSLSVWTLAKKAKHVKEYVLLLGDNDWPGHAPNIAFRHLPPNSARFSYATEGALFISAQLSTDAVGTVCRVCPPSTLKAQITNSWPNM